MTSAIGYKGPSVIAVTWTLGAVAIVAVSLRAYSASRINGRWRWDFIWAVLSLVSGIVGSITLTLAVAYGLGNKIDTLLLLDTNDVWSTIYWLYITLYLGLVATTFAKYSMIALVLQVSGPNAWKTRIGLWVLGAIFTVVNIAQIAISATQCSPREKLWDRLLAGNCDGGDLAWDFAIVQGSVGAFADLILALTPVSIAWNLQTTRRVKVMFCGLMAIGLLPCILTAFRVTHLPSSATSPDITADFALFMILCVSEFWAIVILTSIPVLRPLFLRIFYGIKSKGSSYARPSGHGVTTDGRGNTSKQAPTFHSHVVATHKDDSDEDFSGRGGAAPGITISTAYAVADSKA